MDNLTSCSCAGRPIGPLTGNCHEVSNMEHANDSDFEEKVLKSDIPVVVDFFADWCMPCKMFAPTFEAVSQEYTGKMKFVKVNTEDAQETAGNLGIMSIPTLAIFKKGEEVERVSGAFPKDQFKAFLDKNL